MKVYTFALDIPQKDSRSAQMCPRVGTRWNTLKSRDSPLTLQPGAAVVVLAVRNFGPHQAETGVHVWHVLMIVYGFLHMPTGIQAYKHTNIHAYIQTYMHTYRHTYIQTYMHTGIHTIEWWFRQLRSGHKAEDCCLGISWQSTPQLNGDPSKGDHLLRTMNRSWR